MKTTRRRWLMSHTAAPVLALALLAGAAQAQGSPQEPARSFEIASQPLAEALMQFSRQADMDVVASADLTRGKTVAGLRGAMTPSEALGKLLTGTGLRSTPGAGGGLILMKVDEGPQAGSAGGGAETNVVQELVVTAQKKSENIQVVPIAISAFTQQDLTTRQVAGGPDLMTQVPNFTFTKTNFSGYSIQIRGIGTQAISATVDPAVAVAFNNTPFIRNRFFEQEFYDLERLEVLRGPQGTLYGRNATAGVVNLISAKPNLSEFQAKASGDIANYSSKRLEGMVNIPLVTDKAALRLAGAWTKRDGFVTNTITGQPTDGRDLWSARATLGLEPTSWFKANLIYEHFSENDDRLRSGKQLCHTDPTPSEIDGVPVNNSGDPVFTPNPAYYWTQGCRAASLYSPDSYQTPNGFALPYGPAASLIGAPVSTIDDPYLSRTQSSNLREIETRFKPDYEASNNTVELQLQFQLPHNLTLASESGFNRDYIYSFEDFNRFNTRPGIFTPGSAGVDANGFVCTPQLGCSDRMAAADLSTAKSRQFSQEFRLSSNSDGPLNFSLGANFLRYDTEDKYYVFFNTLAPLFGGPYCQPGYLTYDPRNGGGDTVGYAWLPPIHSYGVVGLKNAFGCAYEDTNDIHHLNDEGRNYFLSKNPYHLLSYAAFGELYWQIDDDLKLTAGLRWTDDKKQAPQIPSWLLSADTYGLPTLRVINQEWKQPTGRLALDWKPKLSFTDETLLYASYVRGYKAGGANPPGYIIVNAPVFAPFEQAQQASLTHPQTFKPEFVNAFEVGTKNTLLDGKLTFNLNAFYYDYTGYQISQIVDRSAVNLNFDAKIWGSELEIDWRPLRNLRLGLKNGYENTQLDKGSSAIDLMDRTAGHPGWLLKKPFPTVASNCIVPEQYALTIGCFSYLDPSTLPYVAPNNGEGFTKDLSGNELPNAPHFTTTITADYTIPMPHEWLATLHIDLYRQSEAWTRIFNTPGYDRLKAYTNVNLAAIFSNEASGLQVMAYVKNVFNKDNITGAFLNSDDTGLTTNVFLNEPRLYGVRVTKSFNGEAPLGSWFGDHKAGAPYPFRLELDGDYGRFSQGHERFSPDYLAYFNSSFPHHEDAQSVLNWGSGGGAKLTYTPDEGPWTLSASVRYGRAKGQDEAHAQQRPATHCNSAPNYNFRVCIDPTAGTVTVYSGGNTFTSLYGGEVYSFYDSTAHNQESHANVDFMVGRDFGLGSASSRRINSNISAGVEYADLRSSVDLTMYARPDVYFVPDVTYPPPPPPPPLPLSHVHAFRGEMQARREFQGAGPALKWDGAVNLVGNQDTGRVSMDAGLGGAVLFGKQKTRVNEHLVGVYAGGTNFADIHTFISSYDVTLDRVREKSVTVPSANANLGLSYELGRLKMSGGYRWERYFKAIDAGVDTRKTYDRQFDGPYVKVSVGFGG